MATESSDPRIGLIVRIGILAVVTLIGTRAALVAYFDRMATTEEYKKIGSQPADALMNLRSDEAARLSAGAMPLDKSMQMLAARGRMGASPDIVPSASKDVAPLQGWVQMPADVPGPMMAANPATSASASPPVASGSPSASPSAAPSAAPAGSNNPRHP